MSSEWVLRDQEHGAVIWGFASRREAELWLSDFALEGFLPEPRGSGPAAARPRSGRRPDPGCPVPAGALAARRPARRRSA